VLNSLPIALEAGTYTKRVTHETVSVLRCQCILTFSAPHSPTETSLHGLIKKTSLTGWFSVPIAPNEE
jgi:hypothetical protein